jgi:ribosomal protein L31
MKNLKIAIIVAFIFIGQTFFAQTKTAVASFNEVIISPHIETTFVQGNEESVTIIDSTEPADKINIEVKGNTLRVYLDDAKETTKHKKVKINGVKRKVPIYKGKVLTILVTYKNIDDLSLRGEQATLCESLIDNDAFKLKIYGESQVTFNEVRFMDFEVAIYGESELTIKKGHIEHQNITAYGEANVNLIEVANKTSKLKAYGEAEFRIQASEQIKLTAYGEATLLFKGTAKIVKGLSIGDVEITKID